MGHRMVRLLCGVVLLVALTDSAWAFRTLVDQQFAPDKWAPAAWTLAKFPGVEHLGNWVQGAGWIENETPANPARQNALDQTLTTMIYRTKFSGDFTAIAAVGISAGATAGIALVQDWAPDAQGRPQYGEFYEVVLGEQELSLWHHFAAGGDRTSEKIAFAQLAVLARGGQVMVERKGKYLALSASSGAMQIPEDPPQQVPGFTIQLNSLPDDLYLGVKAGGGPTRVMSFWVGR